jgi:CHASE2 domain-containing sensor protein
LLEAIRATAGREPAIPVILAVALKADDGGGWSEVANIFADSALPVVDAAPDLPTRAAVGFVNAPLDRRQLPLVFDAKPVNGGSAQPIWSFGLRTADAYDGALDIAPTASDTAPIRDAIADGEFAYGTFLPQSAFLHVSANDLLNGTPRARAALNHRVVLIGGVRHDAEGRWVDLHDTPLGAMPGVYIHANRIEAILDERIKLPVPWWVPLVVDIFLGLAMVIVSARARTPADQLGLVALFAVPFLIAYFAFVNLQCSIDFALPLFVLMLHLVLEKYREFGHGKGTVKAADAA